LAEGDVAGPYSDSAALESLRLGYVSAALTWGVRPEPADDLVVEAVGADALAFIVHPSNQTGPLTRESLRRLFAGELSDWWAFGQSAGAVLPISREEGAGSRAVLEAEVMKGTGLSSGVAIAASDDAVLDYVASTPGAIGYVAASNLREGVRALTVEERRPEPQRVREGDYPLMVGVWLSYVPGGPGEDLARCLAGPSGARALARWYGAPELLVGPD
jgi:phosphate transport system substrate-binding protein